MKKIWTIVLISILVMTVGCATDPKEANEKNFTKAINAYYEKYPCVVTNRMFKFPVELKSGDIGFKQSESYLKKYADIGLLNKSEKVESVEQKKMVSFGKFEKQMVDVKTVTYNLTEEGKKYYRQNSDSDSDSDSGFGFGFFSGGGNGFYYGRPAVKTIENFTEPADMMGLKVCEVQYTYSVEDLQAWAQDEKIRSVDRTIEKFIKSAKEPVKKKATLVLTSNGWVHKSLYIQ